MTVRLPTRIHAVRIALRGEAPPPAPRGRGSPGSERPTDRPAGQLCRARGAPR